ncbi:MAG: insulinase family protein, partial [Chitinophagaceae bacterium]|nr:insulinase family protein [Chitinophagaceae bacterium]
RLAHKWFGPIPMGEKYQRNLPLEPLLNESRILTVEADVPLDAYFKAWHISSRLHKGYYTADLLSDILSGGGSSRLYQSLVKEKQLFSHIDCNHSGSIEPGLLSIEGRLVKGVKMEDAESALQEEVEKMKNQLVSEAELEKVKNKTESMIAFEDMTVMNRANSLAYYELLGNADMMNTELTRYHEVTIHDLKETANEIFEEGNSSTMEYFSKN